jgi:hypothetical protein
MFDHKAKLSEKILAELVKITNVGDLLKGSLVKVATRCGNKNCKCAKGEKHEAYHLTFKNEKGVTRTVYVRKEKVGEVRIALKNYKMVKKTLNKIISLNVIKLKSS